MDSIQNTGNFLREHLHLRDTKWGPVMLSTLIGHRYWGRYSLPDRSVQELKQLCRILFVDDGEFDVPEILINSGWRSTKKLVDVDSLDTPELLDAHIVFVDIAGVGKRMRFADEGLGLISALKQRYPLKKVVVYSAQRRGDRFHEGLSDADERLAKNADPFQFESLVESLAKETFSINGCIQSLKGILGKEFNLHLSDAEIDKVLRRIGRARDFSDSAVAKAFSLQSAGSIASIISLFFNG